MAQKYQIISKYQFPKLKNLRSPLPVVKYFFLHPCASVVIFSPLSGLGLFQRLIIHLLCFQCPLWLNFDLF
jgi:hypothetical protein